MNPHGVGMILALLCTLVNAESSSNVPYADENGNRYWLNDKREWVTHDTNAWRYLWVERWSDEHKRSYFYNQQTKQSTWTRPPDLAWQRVPVTAANAAAMMPQRPSNAGSVREAVTQSQPAQAASGEAAPQTTTGTLQDAPQSAAAA
ncbi:hypothetical protein N2152v2_003540 [Parachlorella kessleri]